MKTRKPVQSKSTRRLLRSIFPESFKIVNDPTSNGYKFINLLYGVEVDEARGRLRELYNNSFVETMDYADTGVVYEVNLSGIPGSQYLNATTAGNIPIKIVNWVTGGEAEFWQGRPTRAKEIGTLTLSGTISSGSHIVGLEYFRNNPSGYGYFIVNTDLDQSNYVSPSGSAWKYSVNNRGALGSYSGLWPGVTTQSFEQQGFDDLLTPPSSGWLANAYPLTREIRDDSGVYWNIDHYEPYHGWVRDSSWHVRAKIDYSGEYYYNTEGDKIWYRTAFNNPYGSGNFTTVYISLRNTPISGTLRLYDIDNVDNSGNAKEISSAGTQLYKLQYSNMFHSEPTGVWEPIYVGYDETVPSDRGFNILEGQPANAYVITSWDYQREGGELDEGTMAYVEGGGDITNVLKITNPQSRYVAEYKYQLYKQARYLTSLTASKYVSLDTDDPIYSLKTVLDNETELTYEFTRNPRYNDDTYRHYGENSRYITFDGWNVRPKSKISKIDFKVPLIASTGPLTNLKIFSTRKDSIGYKAGFAPVYDPNRAYILDCPFDVQVALGTVTENDLSGSGNFLDWINHGDNEIYRVPVDSYYGKKVRHVNSSGYYSLTGTQLVKRPTYFRFRFRAQQPQEIVLMEDSETTENVYIRFLVRADGMLVVEGNGSEFYSRYRMTFDDKMKDIILKYYKDDAFTINPLFDIYVRDDLGFTKLDPMMKTIDTFTVSSTYLRVFRDCSIDIDRFQVWYGV